MPENQSEEFKLFDELQKDNGIQDLIEANQPPVEATPTEPEEKVLKNRMERRQAEKIQRLREENLVLAERLKLLAEQREDKTTDDKDYLKKVERIFGTVDEKGQYDPNRAQATETLKSALAEAVEDARMKAIKEFETRQSETSRAEREAVEQNEEFLDDAFAEVQDTFGIDMDSPKERNAYIELLEEMSPKDRSGEIIEYADPMAVAKVYLKVRNSPTNQAKEVASRSMVRGGASNPSQINEDATLRWLRENNLL